MTKARPLLIDEVYRETFHPRQWCSVKDKPALRRRLESARRFVLDAGMSAFLADLSTAAFAKEGLSEKVKMRLLDNLRVSARLPHQVIWVEYDDRLRIARGNEIRGLGKWQDPTVPEVEGWLIETHPGLEDAYLFHLFIRFPDGGKVFPNGNITAFPFAYAWTSGDSLVPWPSIWEILETAEPGEKLSGEGEQLESLDWGELYTGFVGYSAERKMDAVESPIMYLPPERAEVSIIDVMKEWSGIMRHAWALLASINDIPVTTRSVGDEETKGFVSRGRYRKFLSHQVITLNIPGAVDRSRLARKIIAAVRRRAHQVRGHWRDDWRNPPRRGCTHVWGSDNICSYCRGHRLWIHEHQRGDASIGFVTHDYKVHHEQERN